jgi:hypothetical protein
MAVSTRKAHGSACSFAKMAGGYSDQTMYDFTYGASNLAERYRSRDRLDAEVVAGPRDQIERYCSIREPQADPSLAYPLIVRPSVLPSYKRTDISRAAIICHVVATGFVGARSLLRRAA